MIQHLLTVGVDIHKALQLFIALAFKRYIRCSQLYVHVNNEKGYKYMYTLYNISNNFLIRLPNTDSNRT